MHNSVRRFGSEKQRPDVKNELPEIRYSESPIGLLSLIFVLSVFSVTSAPTSVLNATRKNFQPWVNYYVIPATRKSSGGRIATGPTIFRDKNFMTFRASAKPTGLVAADEKKPTAFL